jgi:3-phenylpropionate/trans-cinnamate dioxygenase ferredoxin subunit
MSDVQIKVSRNGPYVVRGSIELVDAEGNAYELDRATIALCRCGASTTKPFCDGTHSRVGFDAAEAAVPESAE